MRDTNEPFKPIADLPLILHDFFTSSLYLSIQPSPPRNMQLGSNLSLKGLNCVYKNSRIKVRLKKKGTSIIICEMMNS
jgi:hypothetical protein